MAGKFELKQGAKGKYRFNLISGNGQIILSSQMYASKDSAANGIKSVKANAADDGRFDRREAKNGKLYFALKAKNGLDIGKSEMYTTKAAMENGIASVKKNAPDAKIVDTTAK